ncbi:MAG TPA: SDR family oxidoreductase [Polyangiaceae bacterium]|nr:SDR family oxidoreductase [Polyangiaceae bacterium]
MRSAILISGAGGALGSALVAHFAKFGVVVAAGRGVAQSELDVAHGAGRVLAAPLELGVAAAWRELLDRLKNEGFALDGAVLAAGGWRGGTALADTPDDVWSGMLAVNLETARVSLQALLPGMVERGRGSVVVIGSSAAVRPWESAKAAAYAASKAGALALVQASAAEVLANGVRVNALLPSTIDTPANRSAMPKADFSRWVTPASIAEVAGFLLSDAARDVSGAALPVYGRVGV